MRKLSTGDVYEMYKIGGYYNGLEYTAGNLMITLELYNNPSAMKIVNKFIDDIHDELRLAEKGQKHD